MASTRYFQSWAENTKHNDDGWIYAVYTPAIRLTQGIIIDMCMYIKSIELCVSLVYVTRGPHDPKPSVIFSFSVVRMK